MSTRCASIASVLGAAAIAFTALAAPASAAPAPDAKDVIALSWDGDEYTSVIGGSFVGVPVAVPGDSATRTLFVRNDGPSAGTLNASIVNVKILDPNAPDTKDSGKGAEDQGNFYDDLRLAWNGGSANFTTLASRPETEIYDVQVAKGQTVPITIDYRFPIEATSGNKANVSAREASFDVRLTISGDDDPDLPGTETTAPPTDPTATPPSEDPEPSESHPGTETNAPETDPAGTPDDPCGEPARQTGDRKATGQASAGQHRRRNLGRSGRRTGAGGPRLAVRRTRPPQGKALELARQNTWADGYRPNAKGNARRPTTSFVAFGVCGRRCFRLSAPRPANKRRACSQSPSNGLGARPSSVQRPTGRPTPPRGSPSHRQRSAGSLRQRRRRRRGGRKPASAR